MTPDQDSSRPTPSPFRILAAAAVCVYLLLLAWKDHLGWHHAALLLLAWACVSRREGVRRFVHDWWPIILWWVAYDGQRWVEPWLLGRVDVQSPFRWESDLFLGPEGKIWPFHFTDLSAEGAGSIGLKIVRAFCSSVYLTHIWGVPALMILLWVQRREGLFRRMVWTFTAIHILTISLWLLYPAAPPWWVYENGFRLPTLTHSFPASDGHSETLEVLFQLSANRFAAVPSLHGAYPVLLTIVLAAEGAAAGYLILAGAYLGAMWFACVYLNQHYLVDLILGAALVPLAFPMGVALMRLLGRRG